MDFDVQLVPRTGELKTLHNEVGEPSTRQNALEYDPDPYTLINVRIDTVQYGTYDSEPAALIVFRFIARFRSGSRRIRSFHLRIEFHNQAEVAGAAAPKVRTLKPEDVRGKIFTEERSNTISGGLDVPIGPNSATIHVGDEVARKINREYELKLTGWLTSSNSGSDNVLVWDCEEARKAARGIVPNYRGACIVHYTPSQPFLATFKLDAERGIFNFDKNAFEYLNVFAKKDIDDPVIFDPNKPVGHQYANVTDLKNLDLEEIIKLDPITTLPPGYS